MTFVCAADGRTVLRAALVLGLVLRGAIFWHTPAMGIEIVDEQHYAAIAHNILAGNGFASAPGQLTSIRPPLFPAMLASIYAVAGEGNLQAVRLVHFALSLLATGLVYQIGRRMFSPAVGRYAAAATWLYPSIIFFNFTILTETLYILLFLSFLLSAVMLTERPRPAVALACGAALGLACLTRSALWPLPIIFCPLLALILRAPLRTRIVVPVLVFAGYALVVGPWAVRNTRLQRVLTVVDTMGGMNLRLGNYEHTPDDRMWNAVEQTGVKHWAYTLNLEQPSHGFTEGQKAEWAQKQALAYIAAHPGTTLRRAWIKFADFWGLERELAGGIRQKMYAPPRWFAVSAPLVIILAFSAVALLGVAGFWLARARDWRSDVVVLTPVLAILAAHTIAYGHSRYHLPLVPVLALYGAAVARNLLLRIRLDRQNSSQTFTRNRLAAVGAIASVAVLLTVWGRQVLFIDADRIRVFLSHVN